MSPLFQQQLEQTWLLSSCLYLASLALASNDVVRSRTGQPLLSDTIRQRRLSFFGHLCRADTTPELSGPAFGVLPKTGDEELEDRGKPG